MEEGNEAQQSVLYLVRGGSTLPEYNEAVQQNTELQKLEKHLELEASKTLKTKVTVHNIIKYPAVSAAKEFDDVFYDATAIVKLCIENKAGKEIIPDSIQMGDNQRLKMLYNADDNDANEATFEITLEMLETIPDVSTWLEKLSVMFELKTILRYDNKYILKGQWIHVAISRWILLELHQCFSEDVSFKHNQTCNSRILSKFVDCPQFGNRLSGKESVVSSDHDIGLFYYFLCKAPHVFEQLAKDGNALEWKLNFKDRKIDVHFKAENADKIKERQHKFLERLQYYTSNFQSVELPNILPQDYKDFLLSSVEQQLQPELTIKFKGIRHVYLVYKRADTGNVLEYIDKYTKLNKPTSPPIWLTTPVIQTKQEQGKAKTTSSKTITNISKDKEKKSTAIAMFQKEKSKLAQFYRDFAGKIQETARQFNCGIDYNQEMIMIEGNEKSNVLKYMQWLDELYENEKKSHLHVVENHYDVIHDNVERIIPTRKTDLKLRVWGDKAAIEALQKQIQDGCIAIKGIEPSVATVNPTPQTIPVVPARPNRSGGPQQGTTVINFTYKHIQSGSTIEVISGDITQQIVDAIVNAANGDLRHIGGVAKAIARAAGEELVRESEDTIRRLGKPLDTGETCTTSAGNLPCRVVIHAVGPKMSQYSSLKECTTVLMSAFENSLNEAFGQQCSSIAIPAISSGIYGVPPETVTYAAVDTITEFLDTNPQCGLTLIKLVDVNQNIIQLYGKEFDNRIRKGKYRKN